MHAIRLYLVIMLLIASQGCALLEYKCNQSVCPDVGTMKLKGLKSAVSISRDSLGIPYIEAKNEDDLFFAAGYAAAEDRLWQMVFMSMAMQGRLSEIVGKDGLPLDLFMRSMGAKKNAGVAFGNMDEQTRQVFKSYADGVNSYLAAHENLPAEFVLTGYRPDRWTPEDSLYVFGFLSTMLSFNFIEELDFLIIANRVGFEKAAYLFPVNPGDDLPFDEALKLKNIISPEDLIEFRKTISEVGGNIQKIIPMGIPASNNWALSGKRTKSGKSIVANDTHLLLTIPNSWMLTHLKCPTYEAAGVTIPGLPIITLGYNGKVAWGATMVMADSQDIFLEKMSDIDGMPHYLYKGIWVPANVRKEVITVKGRKPVSLDVIETRHGPLINSAIEAMPLPPEMPVQPMPFQSKYGLSLSWAMEDPDRAFHAFYRLASAQSAAEAGSILKDVRNIYLNIVYGDMDNIAWQATGAYPIRKKGKGMLPSPGWTGEYDWDGFLPLSKLPGRLNPHEGFIVTANNKTIDNSYEYNLTNSWYHPDRAQRLNTVLGETRDATAADMTKLQFEQYSLMAKKIQTLLFSEAFNSKIRSSIAKWDDSAKQERALDALRLLHPKNFNAVMAADSGPAALLGAFTYTFTRETFLDELGPEEGIVWQAFMDVSMISYSAPEDHLLYREDSPFWDNITTPRKETKADIIAEALQKAFALCEERMGKDDKKWEWGKIHTYTWRHEFTKKIPFFHEYFNRGPYPAGGDVHSVNAATYAWGDSFDVFVIPAMRMVVDFGLNEPMTIISTPGQSGNPGSTHYDDMIPYFLEGRSHPMPFSSDNAARQYKNTLTLTPVEK